MRRPQIALAQPLEAVESWLSATKNADADYVFSADGIGAWILRDDGTTHTRVSLLRSSGYTVHGYDACSS